MLLIFFVLYGVFILSCIIWSMRLAAVILEGGAYFKIAKKLGLKKERLAFVPIVRWTKLRGILNAVRPGDRNTDKLCVASGVLGVGFMSSFLGFFALRMAGWYVAVSLYEKYAPEKFVLLTCVSLFVPFGIVPCLFYVAKKLAPEETAVVPEDIDIGEEI